jgi:hypothetical protein
MAVSLGLTGCSTGDNDAAPPDRIIELIENKLERDPCIGDLDRWERNYRFAGSTGLSAYTAMVDHGIVEFHLRRAGSFAIRPGRQVLRRGEKDDWPDGPYVQSVDGYFDLGTHALSMPRCSRTATPRSSDGANERRG